MTDTPQKDIVGLRVRSALIVAALAVGLLVIDFYYEASAGFHILAFAAIILGLSEFYDLSRAEGAVPLTVLGIVSAVCLLLVQMACIGNNVSITYAIAGTGVTVALAIIIGHMFISKTAGYFADVGATILGLMYIWFLGGFFFIGLRHLPNGFKAVFVMIAAVKGSDAIAYGVGRKIGRL